MKVQINTPNDYGSSERYAAAIAECYGEDAEAACAADSGLALYDALSRPATDAGLAFISEGDFGGTWEGSPEQVEAALKALPAWAGVAIVEE